MNPAELRAEGAFGPAERLLIPQQEEKQRERDWGLGSQRGMETLKLGGRHLGVHIEEVER